MLKQLGLIITLYFIMFAVKAATLVGVVMVRHYQKKAERTDNMNKQITYMHSCLHIRNSVNTMLTDFRSATANINHSNN